MGPGMGGMPPVGGFRYEKVEPPKSPKDFFRFF